MAPSYQLPDLPSLSRSFELRANPACKITTKASEASLIESKSTNGSHVLSSLERERLAAMKVGLLAAICFPGSDPTQLRLLTDFLTLTVLATRRVKYATLSPQVLTYWTTVDDNDGVWSLVHHDMFNCLKEPLERLASKANQNWKARFGSSVKSFRIAQCSSVTEDMDILDPEIETYLSMNRDLSGLSMIFDLFELTQNLTLTVTDETITRTLDKLKVLATDIVSCSVDVAAFNYDQARGNEKNLISLLMRHKRLSVQGALNYAGTLIKQYIDAFMAEERSLLDPTPSPPSNGSSLIPSWIPFTPLVASATAIPPSTPPDPVSKADLTVYVQMLRDCIVGTLNWIYETDLYFGKKGEEIRTFGWIFLSPKVQNNDSEREVPGDNVLP
uniref:Putative sesquiterpene synthase n=1 Tax=Clitopilus sp. TaxID=1967123 RepID=A0A4P2VH64_9AGAR|nr:putative sesquiterpene synthase [Clitopilus sp.]